MDFPGVENGEIPFFQLHHVFLFHLAVEHHVIGFPPVFGDLSGVFHVGVADGFPSGTQDLDVDVLKVFFRPPVPGRFRFILVDAGKDVFPGQQFLSHRQLRYIPFRQQFQGFFHRPGKLACQPVQMVQISCNHAFSSLGRSPSSLV